MDWQTTKLRQLYNQPYALLSLTLLFWSGNFVLGRGISHEIPPIGLAFWRWVVALALLTPFILPQLRRDWPTARQHWKYLLILGTFGIAAFNTLVYIGLQDTSAINALLVNAQMPIIIVLLAWLWFREPFTPRMAVGLFISMIGVFWILGKGQPLQLLTEGFNSGDLWVFAAVVGYALYSVLLRTRPAMHPLSFIAFIFAIGVIELLPLYLWESAHSQAMPLSLNAVLAVAYVAIFPSLLAYLFFNRGIELIGATRASLFFHLMPVFGSLLAIAFLGEQFQLFHAIGMLLILSGIILVSRKPKADGKTPQKR